jgi:hypothetical protein
MEAALGQRGHLLLPLDSQVRMQMEQKEWPHSREEAAWKMSRQ